MVYRRLQNQTHKEAMMGYLQEHRRQQAIARYLAGDKIEAICRDMHCAKSWLYKWKARYQADDPAWTTGLSPSWIAAALPDLPRCTGRWCNAANRGVPQRSRRG